jgi:periplasmic protein TonB
MSTPARIGALTTLLLHATALAALLTYAPARSALLGVAPIMVGWVMTPAVTPVATPAQPHGEPPKPKRITPRAPRPAPSPVTTAASEAAQPIAPVAQPAASTPAPAEPVAMVSATAPVAAVTLPLFDAAYLDNQPPSYPPLSRRLGEQGRVVLRVLVDANGSAGQVEVRASSGSGRLDESARATVSRWKFVPAKRGGEPFAEWVLVPISFKLEG